MQIQNRTILITGGTSGIGKALAQELKHNNTVIITGRSEERLEQARQNGLIAIPCDLSRRDDLDKLVLKLEQEYPALNVLINNAGIQYNYHWLEEADLYQKIQQEVAVNLSGTMQLTQLLTPLLGVKASTILNVTSALGAVPKSDGLIYSVTKAGLRSFTQGLRKVLKGQSIRVLEVIPPVTDTNMTAGRSEAKTSTEELVKIILRQWKKGKQLIAPTKVKIFLTINRFFPALANKIIQ